MSSWQRIFCFAFGVLWLVVSTTHFFNSTINGLQVVLEANMSFVMFYLGAQD